MQQQIGNRGAQAWLAGQSRAQTIQTKLTVGQPNDKYEKDAEDATNQIVVGQPVGRITKLAAGGISQEPEQEEKEKSAVDQSEKQNLEALENMVAGENASAQLDETEKDAEADKNTEGLVTGEGIGGDMASGGSEAGTVEAGTAEGSGEAAQPESVQLPTVNTLVYTEALASQKPTNFITGVKQSTSDVQQAFNSERDAVQQNLPQIEQPTGIPTLSATKNGAEENADTTPAAYESTNAEAMTPAGKKEGETIPEESVQPPSTVMQAMRQLSFIGRSGSDDDRKSQIRQGIHKLPTSDTIDTNPGQAPSVDLTGEADPAQNETFAHESDNSVMSEQAKNLADSQVLRGEYAIYPDIEPEMLTPSTEISSVSAAASLSDEMPAVSQDVKNSFDTSAKSYMDEQLAPDMEKQRAEYDKMLSDQEQERQSTDAKIDAETLRVKGEQEAAQAQARSDVDTHRESWRTEAEGIKSDYQTQSAEKKAEVDRDIDAQVADTDSKIETEYRSAKTKADNRVNETNREADRRKQEAKEKSKKKSWWDRAIDAIGDFFDKLKEGLNALFDGLRQFVKGVIEAAKKLANKLIDLARDAIVGLIKVFGEALKLLVSVALAAFPELRDKVNALIDKAVNIAVDAVNMLAEGLKKAVNTLLDLLGAALDAILAAYQTIYNTLLDALKFLTVGLIKVLRFLWNLVEGAWNAPGAFLGALAEETIGGDPSQPLPNFEVPLGQEKNWAAAMGLGDGESQQVATGSAEAIAQTQQQMPEGVLGALLNKDQLTDEDVTVEPYPAVSLSPELLASLPPLADGQTLDLGGAGEAAVSTKDFQASAAHAAGYNPDQLFSEEQMSQGAVSQSLSSGETITEQTPATGPDWRGMSDDQKLDHYLNQMLTESNKAGSESPQPQQGKAAKPEVDNSPAALIAKTGRLGVGKRLAFMGEQMMTGIKVLWNKYKAWIIAGLVTALLAAGVVAFFTGGAGLVAAVNIIMKALIVIFGAIAVYRASGEIWNYVKLAWAGDPKAAGKALAKALAIIVVEFLLDKILMGMAKVFKRVVKAVKATRIGRAVGKGASTVRKVVVNPVKRVVKKGIGKVKGSKLVVNMRGTVGRGVKKLSELRRKILDKFGFKRVWLEKKGTRIQIWGEFNAKVLLAEVDEQGNPKVRDITSADRAYLKKTYGNKYEVGRRFEDGGIGVSDEFARQARQGKAGKTHAELDQMDTADIRREMGNTKPEFTHKAEFKKPGDSDDILSSTKPTVRESRSIEKSRRKRQAAIDKRDNPDTYKGVDESRQSEIYNELNKKVIDQSEIIGEKAIDAHMARKGASVEYRGRGSRTVDRVYKKGDTYYVVESKGGASSLGGKRTGGDAADFSQQGTKEYLEQTIADMMRSSDASTRKMGMELRRALRKDKLKYLMSRQKINKNGSLGTFSVSEFDI